MYPLHLVKFGNYAHHYSRAPHNADMLIFISLAKIDVLGIYLLADPS
jgi:hypothetical protein